MGALAIQERTVYVDLSQPIGPRRFTHGHELGHRVLRGHEQLYFADDSTTVHPAVRDLLEAEANQFSADVLYQVDLFTEMAASFRGTGLAIPIQLADDFETSIHSTIRRYVEASPRPCALAVIGRYPVHPGGHRSAKVLQTLESGAFEHRYGRLAGLLEPHLPIDGSGLGADVDAVLRGTAEPVLRGHHLLRDTRRGDVMMNTEVFYNQYQVFALVYPVRRLQRSSPEVRYA